jgi:hypothetical protein
MSNTIIDNSGELVVQMSNAPFAREPLSTFFAGPWTSVRIALYIRINDSGAEMSDPTNLAVGLCAGSTNIMGDATTTHFCGTMTYANFFRSTGPVRYAGNGAVSYRPTKKVGVTVTSGTNFGTAPILHTTAPTMWFVDITKGSPNYTVRPFFCNGTSAPTVTEANFLAQAISTPPSFTGHTYPSGQTIAVDEATDGTFDHACVWWNKANPTFEILYWKLYRISP